MARPRSRRHSKSPQSLVRLRERSALIATLRTLPFLTPQQAALVIDTHPATVRRLLVSGKLRGTQLGKLWRVRPCALDALIG
jgi:excisionase family DNA binding protein